MTHKKLFDYISVVCLVVLTILAITFLNPTSAGAVSQFSEQTNDSAIKIPVGIFVTSIHGIDFRSEQYTMTFWLWATYPTEAMREVAGGDYVPFNTIEIVNAQSKTISPTDQYVVNNEDGTTYAIAKFTATISQHWDVRDFPFDRQNLKLVIESVGIPSSAINFVPDTQNSLVSEELQISGWVIDKLQLEALNYEYRSTFGDPSGQIGIYPRIMAEIPVRRIGFRLFINSFLGFFIAYVIISLIYFLEVNSRIGLIMTAIFAAVGNKYTIDTYLIMTAIFAAVGNKYTIDTYFPNQSAFSLSDLIQICSFGMIAIGIVTTIISMRLVENDKHDQAKKVDRFAQSVYIPAYIVIIVIGTITAIRG